MNKSHLKLEIILPLMNYAAFFPPYMLKSLLTFYFCTLLHLQKKCRLKKSRVKQKIQIVTWAMSNFSTFIIENTSQITSKIIRVHQKARSSDRVMSFQFTLHSNLHSYSPSSEKSIHHFKPTRYLPDRFFTIQKSSAEPSTTATSTLKGLVMKGRIR